MGTLPTAFAQDPAADEQMEEIITTGTRIQKANLVTASPVVQMDAEILDFSGQTRVEDVLNSMPQVYLDQSSGQSIESTGTATMQLRNLGNSRTLVLVDGKRLPIHSPSSATSGPDLNFIPMQLVERVEVLTGGASSVYGSDAVAGVVNFVMMRDFEGVMFDAQMAGYRHDNSGNAASRSTEVVFPGFTPTGTSSDGDTSDFTLIVGGNLADGRGNITAYASKRDIDPVIQADRDYSACANRMTSTGDLRCLGSATNQAGSFYFSNDGYQSIYYVDGDQFVPGVGQRFNFAAPSYYQRPDERYSLGAFAHYELDEHVELYTDLMFMDNRSLAQFGPAGVFFSAFLDVNCGNPFLSDQQRATVGCVGDPTDFTTAGAGGLQTFDTLFGRRNVEGGPRQGDQRHTTYRIVTGVRGDINETWRYDASYQYAEVDMRNVNSAYVNVARAGEALLVDAAGNCLSGNAMCVPWDIWNTGGVDAAQVNWINQQYNENGQTDQEVISAYVQGSLGDYGLTIPSASSGIELVFGIEHREENLTLKYSDNARAGTVGGLGAALENVTGGYKVNEVFLEANIPLVEDKTGAEEIILDMGYRYSDYDPSGQTTDTYKVAASWAITDSIKFRGSYQRAVRAPNIVDQFRPQQGRLFAMDNDPCNKLNPGDATSVRGYTFEECARSGVSQAQWDLGGPADSPAAQYNTLVGGSPLLQPEESDTNSFGVILTPSFAPGLVVSVDWYDIDVQGAITSISSETTLLECIETGNPLFCDKVRRGVNDSLWLGLASATNGVSALDENIGFFRVEGIDAEITYDFDVGNGSMTLNNVTGIISDWEQEEYVGAGIQNCEGVYGGNCGTPTVKLRNRFQAIWALPVDVTLSLGWRHIDSVDQIQSGANPPVELDSMNYFDLAANWAPTDWLNLRLGVNNITDEEPPFVSQGVTARENGNTYPGAYDALGSYWFFAASVEF
ncbi:MAG: TonB-dependent receptor [Woeseiaceae bacterium]|nr:TonB-dependent receptor [Woeseiaceae bacterium]NIP21561.1 TonB-dependent receptor [Woeseiaceae bacterium]NIS90549.1 TonB-dependent receptor [Woeseiaceae bacterium]